MPERFVLWDFGDTLADQNWMLEAPTGHPRWPKCWEEVVRGDTADRWFAGDLNSEEIARSVSEVVGMKRLDALAHMRQQCTRIEFFHDVLSLAVGGELRHAIVTINPDLFSEIVVPHYALADRFEVIVTSWQERTLDKAELCHKALARLAPQAKAGESILVDNTESNVRAWEEAGGHGHVFRGPTRSGDVAKVLRALDS